jgi:anaerobic magnesium-protoporphyrin IX monomethyl ester cyclase
MKIKMVSLEDGITSCGFRKMAAYAGRLNADTDALYVSTKRYRSVKTSIRGTVGGKGELEDDEIDEIAQALAGADIVGFSSMTGYSELTKRIMTRLRHVDPNAFILWGGIHPIIHPEDAVKADVDAICTGEGEFAFEEFLGQFKDGNDYTNVGNMWFPKPGGDVKRNGFLPLMTAEEMETLPFPQYGNKDERIYQSGEGFRPITLADYLANDGLGYTTLWSIGCPFHCSFCGNTKFIANDPKYKKIRHPSARYIVNEIKDLKTRLPHISQVSFHDDSFMAITYKELEEFAELWRAEVDLPFAVYGVIPNYVKREKFEILTWAGMNRVRMGLQSGSEAILDFYKRPTPPARILEAGEVIASFSPKYHIPAAYDIIMDNPVETRQDVLDTLELLYKMDRPYTLFIYSLRVIPNTEMDRLLKERGIDLEMISSNYGLMHLPPRAANLILYVLAVCKPPRWLFDRMLKHVQASTTPQREYPRLAMALRTVYMAKRVLDHTRRMDFSIIPGWTGYVFWRLGIVGFWRKHMTPRPPRPVRPDPGKRLPGQKKKIPLVEDVSASG